MIFTLYHNPATDFINIEYGLTKNTHVDVSLIGIDGKLVKTIAQLKNQDAGVYALNNINVCEMNRGIYFLKIQTDNAVFMRKFVLN